MIDIKIEQKKNGYVYTVSGSVKNDGEYICKNTEEFIMFEQLIEVTLGYKVRIERR